MSKNSADEIFLVDGSGYIFRAYFALPQNLTNPAGQPVGAVLGFSNMMVKLIEDLKAPYLAVIFDAARKNFRYDIYDQYKANRTDPPDDLIPQFPLFRTATEAFGVPAIEVEGYEADDIIATYAKKAVAEGKRVTIVGSDKDLMQLVNDNVRLYDPIKAKYIGADEVMEKFGVAPDKVIDVQALAGDSVDNIPGVPGIGVKTAAQLITEYGSLEELLARAGEIKQPKRREALIDNADLARISKRLVTLADDAPLPVGFDSMIAQDYKRTELYDFLRLQGFKTLLTRLGQSAEGIPAQSSLASPAKAGALDEPQKDPRFHGEDKVDDAPYTNYTLINDMGTLKEWIAEAYDVGACAIDTETTHLTPAMASLVGISIASRPGKAAYIPLGHGKEADLLGDNKQDVPQLPHADVMAAIKPLLEDESVLKIGQNIKYDWQIFKKHGITLNPIDDTMLISYTLDGTLHSNGMDDLSQLFLGHTPIPYADVAGKGKSLVTFDKVDILKARDYAAEDADVTLRLHRLFKPRLAREQMVTLYEEIERPLSPVIAQMELDGIKIDPKFLKVMSADFAVRLIELEKQIQKMAGTEFNVGSPKQIGEVLFDQMGLPGGSKTKTGQWSTDAGMLEDLAEQGHEIVQKILEWRQLSKLKSTYTDALQEQINPATGRVHTSFACAHTSTGRLASSDPNLQNIPIRTEEGRKIRQAFIAEDGHVLLSADYSQVELRLAAEMADVKALKQAFKDNKDIHAMTAARVFGLKLEDVTPELRRQAKAVNFGIIYGISGWGLAKQLGIDAASARDFINRYLTAFSEIQDFMETTKEFARKHEYVQTLFGRKCYTPNINAKNGAWRAGAERAAINAPLQGTAADIMKKAMIKIPPALKAANLNARMLLQVHDELIFEVPEAEAEQTAARVKDIMENVVTLSVPLVVETGIGKNWGEAH